MGEDVGGLRRTQERYDPDGGCGTYRGGVRVLMM